MKKVSPSIIDSCIKSIGISPQDFLSLLIIAKKLYIRHWMQMTKKEYIEVIAWADKKLASILCILNELHCKNAEDVATLIRDMSNYEDFFLCSVDTSRLIDVWPIDKIIEETIHKKNVYMSKWLRVPWLHVISNSHRYGRTIQDDMDKMLNG